MSNSQKEAALAEQQKPIEQQQQSEDNTSTPPHGDPLQAPARSAPQHGRARSTDPSKQEKETGRNE